MSHSRVLAAALAALALAVPARSPAQVSPELEGLLNEPVVSTASRAAETAELAPATTSILTADDLRRHGITSLDAAINYLSLGMVVEQGVVFGEIGARGVLLTRDYGNHVLVLINGHALNEGWDGAAYFDRSAAIPFDLVDHIEVILGPGSVLYGSQAMLGVINVITVRARDYLGEHVVVEAGAPAAARLSVGVGHEFQVGGEHGEVTFAVDGFRSWGPRQDYGPQAIDGSTWGGEAHRRSIQVPAAYGRLVLGSFELDLRAASARRAAVSRGGSFDDPHNWDGDRWLSGDLRWSGTLARDVRVSARLYGDLYRYQQRAPDFVPSNWCLADQVEGCTYELDGTSRWAGAEVTATADWLLDGRYVTLVGVDARVRRLGQEENYRDAATDALVPTSHFDRDERSVGAYLQQVLRPLPWLQANLGLRLDHDDQIGAHLSPRVAVVVAAWAGGTVKAIYSEAFRAPTGFERYYSDPTGFVASPGLRPEVVRSAEAVVEQRWSSERVRLTVSRSWWTDLVVAEALTDEELAAAIARGDLVPGLGAAYTYRNASHLDGWALGADWEGSRLGQRLRYGASLTVARARRDGSALPAAAELFGNARVSYGLGTGLPVLGLAARFAGARPVAATSFSPTPTARPQVELRGSASGPLPGAPHLSWSLSVNAALGPWAPYGIGPLQAPAPGYDAQELAPVTPLQVMAGLRGDW